MAKFVIFWFADPQCISTSDPFFRNHPYIFSFSKALFGFVVAPGEILSEGYGHDGPGVCLGDGQMEAEGVPSQGGRVDQLLRRMPPYLTPGDYRIMRYASEVDCD